ncbi:hypothetical protein D3C87_1876400 [compost metagenome]
MTEGEIEAAEARRAALIAENEAMIIEGDLGGVINGCAINVHAINDDRLNEIPGLNRTVSVGIYADDELVATVSRTNRMARLPSGFLATRWKVGVSSDMPITQITLATTGAELMEI